MEITRERVRAVVTAFRPYGVALMQPEKEQEARDLLASLVADVHATGREDLIECVDQAEAQVTRTSAGAVELWLDRLAKRL